MEAGKLRIQDYLSFGYVYLVTLGILRDSIYYGFMGINIMSYSNVLDVLLSPIAYLTTHPVITFSFLLLFAWLLIQPSFHQRYREKKWYQRLFNVEKRDKDYAQTNILPLATIHAILIFLTSFFIGTGLGGGYKKANKLANKEFEMTELLTFSDGTQSEVKIIGQNSNYIFYAKKESTTVSVTPINGNIKSIEQLAK